MPSTTPNDDHATNPVGSPGKEQGRGRGKGSDARASESGSGSPVANTSRGDGSFEALATPLRDLLTGEPGDVGTFFTWTNLTDSLLKGAGRTVLWDRVVDFTSVVDGLDAPANVTTTEITALSGSVAKLVPGQIHSKGVGASNFAPNTAAAFTCKGFDGVFVVFNDAVTGYQPSSDSLIHLAGYTFAPIGIY